MQGTAQHFYGVVALIALCPMVPSKAAKPRAELGETLRQQLCCPLCSADPSRSIAALLGGQTQTKPLRVVAFRVSSVRLECRECGLRFSIDPENFTRTVAEQKDPVADSELTVFDEIQEMTGEEVDRRYRIALTLLRHDIERLLNQALHWGPITTWSEGGKGR